MLTLLIFYQATTAAISHAATVAEARNGIQAAIEKRMVARHNHDATAYLFTFEPTWTLTSVTGKTQTYAEMRKTMIDRLAHLTDAQMFKMKWKITSITASGGEAHATLVAQYELPLLHAPKGIVHVYLDTVSDSVWDKHAAGWTQRSEEYLYDAKTYSRRALAAGERQAPRF